MGGHPCEGDVLAGQVSTAREAHAQAERGAIAHRLLVICYHLLRRRVPYAELGTAPLDQQQVARHRRRLVEQLIGLGVKVTIEEGAAIA